MHPEFIDAGAGALFILYHPPAPTRPDRGDIVFIPPFAEELNRSRHMVSATARALSAAGWGVLIPDLFGTGDSGGEFAEARWDIWQRDVLAAIAWLKDRGRPPPGIWAMRTGALILGDLLAAGHRWSPLVFWQPVTAGKSFMTQFLRIALAAEMTASDSATAPKTVSELRQRADAGETLEIAGYGLHPSLLTAIDAAALSPPDAPEMTVHWLELADTAPQPSPGMARAVEAWRDRVGTVTARAVAGPRFWMLQEPEPAEALIAATCEALEEPKP